MQQLERAPVGGPGPHLAVEAGHGLEVVVEHVGPRRENRLQGGGAVAKVGHQELDARLGQCRAQRLDRRGEVSRAAVG